MNNQRLRSELAKLDEEVLALAVEMFCPNQWRALSPSQQRATGSLMKKSFQGKESAS